MQQFAEWVIRYRRWVIGVTIILTIFFGYQLRWIQVNSDLLSYLNPDDPAVQLFNRVGETYAGTALAMVGLEADDVFTYPTLETIHRLTEQIKQIPGVASVTSLTDVLDIRGVAGGLEVGKLINPNAIPEDPQALQQLRQYTLSKDMYNGRLVSPDGRITIIVARIQQKADKQAVAQAIQQVAQKEAGDYRLYFSGLPMQMIEINAIILQDMFRLVPVVILVLVGVLYFSFRSIRGVVLPLLTVLISTLWAMGLMVMANVPLSIISNIMPVVLIAVGSAYGIHVIARYKEDIHHCQDVHTCIRDALAEVGFPIILAGLTTLIGFFSFVGSYLTSVTHFGVFTGLGVLIALIVSITFLPAVLSYLKPPRIQRDAEGRESHFVVQLMDALTAFVLRHEKLIVGGSVVIIIVALLGLPRLHREVNMLEYFPEDTEIRIAENMMKKNFGGSYQVQIVVQGDLKHPAVLKEMRRLEKLLRNVPDVSKPQSVADLISEMNGVMNGHYTIPDTREGVANLWFFIESEPIMEQLVNADATEGIIQATLASWDTGEILRAVNRINRLLSQMDTAVVYWKVQSPLPPEILRTLNARMASTILQDAHFYGATRVDSSALFQKTLVLWQQHKAVIPPALLDTLTHRLQYFFEEESEIEIANPVVERRIIQTTRQLMAQGELPSEKALVEVLERFLPPALQRDSETIRETAYSMHVFAREVYQQARVQAAMAQVLSLFPDSLQQNAAFRDDLRDDLWLLNASVVPIPVNVARQAGITGETVRMGFVQTGMPTIFTRLDESLVRSQVQSLAIAFVLVAIILMVQLRSVGGGLLAVSPIALTVLLNFAIMAYLGVGLDNATMMIASIAIGIGIDYAIHFSNRFKEELSAGRTQTQALEVTLRTTGRAILINAASVALGFIVLLFARLVPLKHFGWLTATTMVFSAAGAITFLPAVLLLTGIRLVGHSKQSLSGSNQEETKN